MCHSFGQIWDFSQCPLYSDTKWLSTGDSFQEDGGSRHRNDWPSASDLVALSRRNTHLLVNRLIETSGWDALQTMDALKIPANKQEKYAKQL